MVQVAPSPRGANVGPAEVGVVPPGADVDTPSVADGPAGGNGRTPDVKAHVNGNVNVNVASRQSLEHLPRLAVLLLIRAYQGLVSPGLPPGCRFEPTCSRYAYAAVERYGVLRGGWLAVRRVLRCHPWGGSGYDPVP